MHIVKLGGSLYSTAELRQWLTHLAGYARQEAIIIVPGGGPFADNIRKAQALHQFDDQHAHHMAILAMAQYGLLLHALIPEASLIKTPQEVESTHKLSLWLPDDQLLKVDDLTPNWSITSDSLALWFTQQCIASKLTLIKRVNTDNADIARLSQDGVIDKGFVTLYQSQPVPAQLIHYQHLHQFPAKGLTLK